MISVRILATVNHQKLKIWLCMLCTQIFAAHYTAVVPLSDYPYMYIPNLKLLNRNVII